jgi:hypothetical protein
MQLNRISAAPGESTGSFQGKGAIDGGSGLIKVMSLGEREAAES